MHTNVSEDCFRPLECKSGGQKGFFVTGTDVSLVEINNSTDTLGKIDLYFTLQS
jgi:hypothetical protein